LAKPIQELPGLPPAGEVERFLRLLDDVRRIQQLLLEETVVLRARVLELETQVPQSAKYPGRMP
jgi:hypothetical protein